MLNETKIYFTKLISAKDTSLFLSVIIIVGFLVLWRIFSVPSFHEIESDAYYHVMMGYLFPDIWNSRTFPWTDLSIWKISFYDKEWGFHLLINIFYRWKSLWTSVDLPPFNYYFAIFAFISCTSFAYCVKYIGGRMVFFWLMLFAFISPLFFYRFLMLRPQIISIAIFAVSCSLFFKMTERRHLNILAFILSFIYVYFYSHPHLIFIPVLIRFAMEAILRKCYRFDFVLCALLGFISGLTLYPQFPEPYHLFWIQCVTVSQSILSGSSVFGIGDELRAPHRGLLFDEGHLYVVLILNLILFFKGKLWKDDKSSLLFCCFISAQTFLMLGFLFSQRVIEYAIPVTVLSSCLIWTNSFMKLNIPAFIFKIKNILLILVAAAAVYWTISRNIKHAGPELCKPAFLNIGYFLKSKIKAGTVIANINWSDFPFLFYAAPDYRYSVGLDPFFGAALDYDKMKKIEAFRSGTIDFAPGELMELLGTRFVFVSNRNPELVKKMYSCGYVAIFRANEGQIFDLILSQIPKSALPL